MAQNTSSAVMQQRREPSDALDDFPTPPWATRALCEWLQERHDLAMLTVREPTCNRGHMVHPLAEYFAEVLASDVHDYGHGFDVRDYLFPPEPDPVPWTITNPPFRVGHQFAEQALRTSTHGVALFVRTAFLESETRFERIFRDNPPTAILQFCERVVIHRGRLVPNGSTATAYCWLVWGVRPREVRTELHWIAPGTRARLERAADYPSPPVEVATGSLL
ncbi:MAG: methyltransferase [Pseudomonadota bacterium]